MNFYRYYAGADGAIFLQVLGLRKQTPKGYWVSWFPGDDRKMWKWVSATARKRYCYPTREEAWESFRIRTSRRKMHLERNIKQSNWTLQSIEKLGEPPKTDYYPPYQSDLGDFSLC